MKSWARRKPRRLEAPVVEAIVRLLTRIGASVYRAQQHGWAASDPGQPDLTVFLPSLVVEANMHLWIECKAPGGTLSADQRRFQAECEAAGCPYVVAESTEDVLAWLHDYGTGHVTRLPDGSLALTQAALRAGTRRPASGVASDPRTGPPETPPPAPGPQRGTQAPG